MSDHLYYLSVKGGGPGDVHSYFNPCSSPIEAFAGYSRIISDLEARIMQELERPEFMAKRVLRQLPIGRGFTFFYEFARPSQWTVHGLDDFYSALKTVNLKSIRFHVERGDFERWVRQVVGDDKLASKIAGLSDKKLIGEKLRKRILSVVGRRIEKLQETAAKVSP